jgi:hypothetical protein
MEMQQQQQQQQPVMEQQQPVMDEIDLMLAGHQGSIHVANSDAAPLVEATPPETTPVLSRKPSQRSSVLVSPSPKPQDSKGKPIAIGFRQVQLEPVARKPAIPKMKTKKSSPPQVMPNSRSQNDPAEVASRMAHMTARERVELGLRQMRSMQDRRPSSAFATSTPRTSFGLVNQGAHKTPQQAKKEQLIEEKIGRLQSASRSCSATAQVASSGGTMSLSHHQRFERQSSWARDTVQRGLYTFNWQHLPQTVPRMHVDPSPGPGAYTSPLHFVGMK